jgi:hydroxymethylpyrimidine pyrophosphatase-like HAD family hydrolase
MRYWALACDYDGTLASGGVFDPAARAALARLKAAGRRLLLVTGRRLDDLYRVCPETDLFDAIVAENGALVQVAPDRTTPTRPAPRQLAEPPPAAFVAALRARGIDPVDTGRVVVATAAVHEPAVREVIRSLRLPLEVARNKGALMVLPAGIDKGTGLLAALGPMGVPGRAVVAVGDAENDLPLYDRSGFAVAVANALPGVQARADLVTVGAAGAGVAELARAMLDDALPPRGTSSGAGAIAGGRDVVK